VDVKTGTARASGKLLAEKLGLNVRQTWYLIEELIRKGFIERVKRGGPTRHAANVYRLIPEPSKKKGAVNV
jgi:hypothetical protein